MILTSVLLAVAGVALVGAIAVFWNSILDWIKRAIVKVQEIVQGVLYGTNIFMTKVKEAAVEIQKHYSKIGTKWQETIVKRNVGYSELPEEIQQKINRNNVEVDMTQELELAMKG